MLRIRTSLGLAAVALAAACDDGATVAPPLAPDASSTATTPTGAAQSPAPQDTARGPATPPPSTSPRDSVAISVTPGNALLAPGRTVTLDVRRYAAGAWTPATNAAFASANPAVATVSAGGVVTGVAVGTTSVRVTVGEIFVTLPIVVTADGQPPQRTPSDTAGRGPSAPPAYVAEFTLGGRVFDATPGPDSATFRPIAGVTLTLVAVDQAGQPLSPERVAGTATTDAGGRFTLPRAPGGWYRLDVTPPAGSGYRFSSVLVSRPVRETLQYDLALRKQP